MRADLIIVVFLATGFSFIPWADAVCCFPYNVDHYIDPATGNLVLNGELFNDSYLRKTFGNIEYRYEFFDEDRNVLFEKALNITGIFPIGGGAHIPYIVTYPFQIMVDVDRQTASKVYQVGFDGTERLIYFPWKPADLRVSHADPVLVDEVSGADGKSFNVWQISGNLTNLHHEKTHNAHVVASLRDGNGTIVGVAGYADAIQPGTVGGGQTKEFVISGLVDSSKVPVDVVLYAESDESSMLHEFYRPMVMRGAMDHDDMWHSDPKRPVTISANVTNISRDAIDFEWIIQIKKSPKPVSEGDTTEYPESRAVHIKAIPSRVDAQDSALLQYDWFPQHDGIYFYEMYLWADSRSRAVSFPFVNSFLDDNFVMVNANLDSVTGQIKSGASLDDVQCQAGLITAHKADNGNVVCVHPHTKATLLSRQILAPESLDIETPVENSDHPIRYQVDGDAKIQSISFEERTDSLRIIVDADTDGGMILEIPRGLIDSGHTGCSGPYSGQDSEFIVLADKREIASWEFKTTKEFRTLYLPVEKGSSEIEVISVCLI